MSLSGKVALVTGAARGLGKAFSEALLNRGAKVCLADVLTKEGETTASEFQQKYGKDTAMFVKCDVTSTNDMEKTFSTLQNTFGHLDIMVNNAGLANEFQPQLMIDVNVTGVVTGTRLAIDAMNKAKGGRGGVIINIASVAGITPKAYMMPTYTASKFAITGLTRCWSQNPHIKQMGLRFACLCPAFTDTAMLAGIDGQTTLYPEEGLQLVRLLGINKVSAVVDGFVQLVEDEQCNGAIMAVSVKDGIHYYKKPLALGKL